MQKEEIAMPKSRAFKKGDSNSTQQFQTSDLSFYEIFKQALHNSSGSRPPKFEMIGLLVPLLSFGAQSCCHYKLETGEEEFLLKMSDGLLARAKKLAWEKVKIKGFLDLDSFVFEVEKMSLAKQTEPIPILSGFGDLNFELEQIRKTIAQMGRLTTATDDLAS